MFRTKWTEVEVEFDFNIVVSRFLIHAKDVKLQKQHTYKLIIGSAYFENSKPTIFYLIR